MREPESIVEGCLRILVRHEIEDAQTLDCPWWSVNPRIILPGAVVSRMAYADSQNTRGARAGAAGPPVEPDITHVRGVITRGDVSVRRRKYRHAAAIEFSGNSPVANVRRPPVRSARHH